MLRDVPVIIAHLGHRSSQYTTVIITPDRCITVMSAHLVIITPDRRITVMIAHLDESCSRNLDFSPQLNYTAIDDRAIHVERIMGYIICGLGQYAKFAIGIQNKTGVSVFTVCLKKQLHAKVTIPPLYLSPLRSSGDYARTVATSPPAQLFFQPDSLFGLRRKFIKHTNCAISIG